MKKSKIFLTFLLVFSAVSIGSFPIPSHAQNMRIKSVEYGDEDQEYQEIERFIYQCLFQDDFANSPEWSGFYNRKMNFHFKRLEIKRPLDTGPADGVLHSKLLSRDLKKKIDEANSVMNRVGADNVSGMIVDYLSEYDEDNGEYIMDEVADFLFPEADEDGKGMYFDITEVTVEDGNAEVVGDWSGQCERHIYLVKENGRWKIDDINLIDASSYSWKDNGSLKKKVSEFINRYK